MHPTKEEVLQWLALYLRARACDLSLQEIIRPQEVRQDIRLEIIDSYIFQRKFQTVSRGLQEVKKKNYPDIMVIYCEK